MEILNVLGLLFIGLTNAWIAVQVKNQKTQTNTQVTVQPAEVDYEALAKAMESSWPTVNVSNDLTINYDLLAEAISKFPAPVVQPLPVVIQNPPSITPVQSPTVFGDTSNDDNVITINGFPARQFPAKANP